MHAAREYGEDRVRNLIEVCTERVCSRGCCFKGKSQVPIQPSDSLIGADDRVRSRKYRCMLPASMVKIG